MQWSDLGITPPVWYGADAVIVADVATERIILWNPAAEALFGYTPAQALGLPIALLVPPSLRAQHRAGLAHYRETRHGPIIDSGVPVPLPALHKTGNEIVVELTLTAMSRADLEGDFVLASIRDARVA